MSVLWDMHAPISTCLTSHWTGLIKVGIGIPSLPLPRNLRWIDRQWEISNIEIAHRSTPLDCWFQRPRRRWLSSVLQQRVINMNGENDRFGSKTVVWRHFASLWFRARLAVISKSTSTISPCFAFLPHSRVIKAFGNAPKRHLLSFIYD